MQEAAQVFAEIASIPTVSSGQFTNSCEDFELSLSFKNFGEKFSKKFSYLLTSKHSSSFVEQVADIKFRSFSPDGSLLLVGRVEKKSDQKAQISIEIWEGGCLLKSIAVDDLHGEFCLDEVFGSTAWSPSASKFMYVAERKRKEQNGFEKFILVEHFGEKLFSVTDPVICVLDLESFSVKVVDLVNFENSFPSQPVFVNDDTLCFTGIEIGSKKLGMTYIYCRNSSIYSAKLEDGSVKAERLTDPSLSCRSPVVSLDESKICFLSNSIGLSHFKCSQLLSYDVHDGRTTVIVDFVEDPKCKFPGLFTQRIPPQRFTSKLLLTSCWFNDRPLVQVDLLSGEVERIFPEFDGCFRVLYCRQSSFLIAHTKPDRPGDIFIYNSESKRIQNIQLPIMTSNLFLKRLRDSIDYKVIELNQQVSVVLTKPKNATKPLPLIILPHGGPNSVYSVDYVLYPNVLAMLGYAMASINYTGSIGFGNRSIAALEGNIGVRDVEDCYLCTELLLKSGDFDPKSVWLMGGSHGGYLAAFLSARYPETFRGAILRNPVIDLPSMLVTSDIPDWTFGQLGLPYDLLRSRCPTADELILMRERSPSTYSKSVKCPSLIMLSAQDLRVQHSQGLYWSNLLKSAGVITQVMLFPDANHGLETADSEKFGFLAIVDFLFKN